MYTYVLLVIISNSGISQESMLMSSKEICEKNQKVIVEEVKKSHIGSIRTFCLPNGG